MPSHRHLTFRTFGISRRESRASETDMAIGVARTANNSKTLGALEDEVSVSLAIVAEGCGTHPADSARGLLAAAQRQQAIDLAVIRGLVTFDINSKLAASFIIAIGSWEQGDLNFDDFAHFLGVLEIPGTELLQVDAKVEGGLELIICKDESGDNVGDCGRKWGILLVINNDRGGGDNGAIQRLVVNEFNAVVDPISTGV